MATITSRRPSVVPIVSSTASATCCRLSLIRHRTALIPAATRSAFPLPDQSSHRSVIVTQSIASSHVSEPTVEVNGRSYAAPKRPTVVIIVDGFDPAYLEHGIANGTLPTMKSFREHGFAGIADCSMPSTTNTNNTSIVTGVPPVIHGINGNYYLDSETGEEIMITDAARLRCGTIRSEEHTS